MVMVNIAGAEIETEDFKNPDKRELAIRKIKRARVEKLAPEDRIPRPDKFDPSEFEIQAFLYWKLKELGWLVRGEVTTRCKTCILDLVVYNPMTQKPIRIIETKKKFVVKNSKKAAGFTKRNKRKTNRQVERYSQFNVPVDLVESMEGAIEYMSKRHAFKSTQNKED